MQNKDFPIELIKQHLAEFPDTNARILSIKEIIANSPADGNLQIGDVIWKVNNKKIGASLYLLDNAMDNSQNNKVNDINLSISPLLSNLEFKISSLILLHNLFTRYTN